jgi:hypothetical protein
MQKEVLILLTHILVFPHKVGNLTLEQIEREDESICSHEGAMREWQLSSNWRTRITSPAYLVRTT